MKNAALNYYQLAQQTEIEMNQETDLQKEKALRKVAGQLYFYAGTEAIEEKL